jgi:sulfoxide reductase heme-binding subunit YedZ
MVLMLVLTASVVLGVLTERGWRGRRLPGFVVAGLHRNLALLAVPLLVLHGLTMVLDRYARLGLVDILVPFASPYRRVWLGLGVAAGELMLAVVATSLLRHRLGHTAWRLVHWVSYAVWPLALLHGLGTGSDTRAAWALLLYLGCAGVVVLAAAARLLEDDDAPAWRVWSVVALLVAGVGVGIWVVAGPLQPGWAAAAGTPAALIRGGTR